MEQPSSATTPSTNTPVNATPNMDMEIDIDINIPLPEPLELDIDINIPIPEPQPPIIYPDFTTWSNDPKWTAPHPMDTGGKVIRLMDNAALLLNAGQEQPASALVQQANHLMAVDIAYANRYYAYTVSSTEESSEMELEPVPYRDPEDVEWISSDDDE